MDISLKFVNAQYPYLAVWTGPDNHLKSESIRNENIVVISLLQDKEGEDLKPYVQSLMGASKGFFTNSENEYTPLPNGFQVILTQTFE